MVVIVDEHRQKGVSALAPTCGQGGTVLSLKIVRLDIWHIRCSRILCRSSLSEKGFCAATLGAFIDGDG